jgi:hypothetical protein
MSTPNNAMWDRMGNSVNELRYVPWTVAMVSVSVQHKKNHSTLH